MPLKDLLNNFSNKVHLKDKSTDLEKLKKNAKQTEEAIEKPIFHNRRITRAKAKEIKNVSVYQSQRSSLNLERSAQENDKLKEPKRRTMLEQTTRNSVACKRKLIGPKKEQATPYCNYLQRHNLSKIPKLSKSNDNALTDTLADNYPTPELLTVSMLSSEQQFDPYYCEEYAGHIFQYMMNLEKQFILPSNFLEKSISITSHSRSVLVNWLNQVQVHETLFPETFLLCVSMIDRYLLMKPLNMDKLQLLGITCLLIASKYEERFPPPVSRLAFFTADSCKYDEVISMERSVLQTLDFRVFAPTPLHYTRWFCRSLQDAYAFVDLEKLEHLALYFIVSLAIDVKFSTLLPSVQSGATIFLSLLALARLDGSHVTFEKKFAFGDVAFEVSELVPILWLIVRGVDLERVRDFSGAKDQFSGSMFGSVSSIISKELLEDIVNDVEALLV